MKNMKKIIWFKKRRPLDRKGQEMLIDFVSIMVFAFLIVVFLVVFFLTKSNITNNINNAYVNKDAEFWLDSFVKAPANIGTSQRTVGDVMIEDYYNDDYSSTFDLFQKFYSTVDRYNVGSKEGRIQMIYLCINKPDKTTVGFSKSSDGKFAKDTAHCGEDETKAGVGHMMLPNPQGGKLDVYINIITW